MTPAFKITGKDGDLTANFAARLVSMTLTDASAEVSDALDICLSNADGKLIIPEQGYILTVSLGYTGNLRSMGSYMVDCIVAKGFPDEIQIQGKAAPFTGAQGQKPIQSRKTRSWEGKSIGDIVKAIATENGLQAAIDDGMANINVGHFDQICESDLNFLTRLSRDFGAVFKPAMGNLVFARRGTSQSVSGKALPTIVIDRSLVSSYSATLGRRTRVGAVTTKYHDNKLGKVVTVTAQSDLTAVVNGDIKQAIAPLVDVPPADGTTAPAEDEVDADGYDVETGDTPATYEHPYIYPDQATATAAAGSMLDQSERNEHNIEVTIPGQPEVLAEGTLTLTGFNSAIDKDWIITSVAHVIGKREGYRTRIVSQKKRAKKTAGANGATAGAILLKPEVDPSQIVSGGT